MKWVTCKEWEEEKEGQEECGICHFLLGLILEACFFVLVTQSCLTLCDPVDCSLPGSSIHGIFQARSLEWTAISFSRESFWPRDWTQVSRIASRLYCLSHQGSPGNMLMSYIFKSKIKSTKLSGTLETESKQKCLNPTILWMDSIVRLKGHIGINMYNF